MGTCSYNYATKGIKQSFAHLGTWIIADAEMIGRSSMSLPSSGRCPYIQIQAVLGDICVRIPHFFTGKARKIFVSAIIGWMYGVWDGKISNHLS